jgi:hypothetical protein
MWLRNSCREARSSWVAGSVFGSQEPVHERTHQLAASLIPHAEVQLSSDVWLPHTYGGCLLLLFPAVAHQGPGALGARGHRLLRVSDHVHTRSGAVFRAETQVDVCRDTGRR